MIVVSNTSPLTNLAAIDQIQLLHALYGEIHIANAVWEELNAYGQAWPGSRDVANASWIKRSQVQNQELVMALRRDLDRGEAASIALALELNADLLLLDERDGRRAARRLNVHHVGVLGVLLEAKANGLVEAIKPHLDDLRRVAGFYLNEAVYQKVMDLAGE